MKKSTSIMLSIFVLLFFLASCRSGAQTPTRGPVRQSTPIAIEPAFGSGPGPRPPTVVAPTVVYQPAADCQVSVELTEHSFDYIIHNDHWDERMDYTFRVHPICLAAPCDCPPADSAGLPDAIELDQPGMGDYEIQLSIQPADISGAGYCPVLCDETDQLIFKQRLERRGLYAVYLGEQFIGYLDVPVGISSSSGPPPAATRPIGLPTFTLPPGTSYPLPTFTVRPSATSDPSWTLTPTFDPSIYPPPPPGVIPVFPSYP